MWGLKGVIRGVFCKGGWISLGIICYNRAANKIIWPTAGWPVYLVQLKPLKYESPSAVRTPIDFMVDFGIEIDIHFFFKSSRTCAALCDRGSLGDSPGTNQILMIFLFLKSKLDHYNTRKVKIND